ncbi:arginyl-tRNA synthetase [Polyplosphaeria fusca]|uniref:arginine--tRNA ligase n=1 Tax=Polyplosphaeria fusca TaxID=682080 RepID=A0A9P4QMW1_9PLEO|nr:arginyl-tRNA synthetase [Polyplosphaeria fusca]
MDDLSRTLQQVGLNTVPQEPNCFPTINPFDIYRSHITELLAEITGVDKNIILPVLQTTSKLENGDLQMATPALRQKGKDMKAYTTEIVEKFPESPLVKPPVIVNGTFICFFFKPEPLISLTLSTILKAGPSYGFNPSLGLKDPSSPSSGPKKMVIDFSSPNIAKPFHAGHLRSTIIGGFLANVYKAAGWDVVRLNYLGDWGRQYGILALGFQKFGSEEKLKEDPIGHLFNVYVEISRISAQEEEDVKSKNEEILKLKEKGEDVSKIEAEVREIEENSVNERARNIFKSMVNGEPEAIATWTRFRELSIKKYQETYARLNIKFDVYSGESQISEESMATAVAKIKEAGLSEDSQGATIINLTKFNKKLGKALIQKKDGTSLYLTRDIGAAHERWNNYKPDRLVYVVASQQDLHLAQLFQILKAMGGEAKEISERCQHINFGMVLGMSTRKGTVKFLDDILRDVGDKMHEVMKTNEGKYAQVADPLRTADILGISAVIVQDMKGKRVNNYHFDLDRMTAFEGDTGPYLQYAHARLCSIYRKAAEATPDIPSDLTTVDLSLLNESHAIDLVRQLAAWPDVFLTTLKTQEPTTVLMYLFKMAHALSSSYDHLQVVGSERNVMLARLALYSAARQTLNNGMRLLGLSPVERM